MKISHFLPLDQQMAFQDKTCAAIEAIELGYRHSNQSQLVPATPLHADQYPLGRVWASKSDPRSKTQKQALLCAQSLYS